MAESSTTDAPLPTAAPLLALLAVMLLLLVRRLASASMPEAFGPKATTLSSILRVDETAPTAT